MPKKSPNKTKKATQKDKHLLKSPIILGGLIFVLALMGYFGYQKLLDWHNKQLIEGMARDYPALIAGVEDAVEHPLTISSDCFQTREKFSSGVSLCGLTTGLLDEDTSQEIRDRMIAYFESDQQDSFVKSEEFANKEGYTYQYKSKNACQFAYLGGLYIDCAFGVREANKQLASELLSEDILNYRKNKLLNQ